MDLGKIVATSAEITPNDGLVRESPNNALKSGLGIIVIWPDGPGLSRYDFILFKHGDVIPASQLCDRLPEGSRENTFFFQQNGGKRPGSSEWPKNGILCFGA